MKAQHAASRENTEIELKLLVDPAHVDALKKHPLLEKYAKGAPRTEELVSTYFDTPDLQLQQRKAALRVRKTGTGWRQTMKAGGQVEAGLHQHNEWETDIDGAELNLPALLEKIEPSSEWRNWLSVPERSKQLEPLFTTRFRRTIRNLVLPDGTQIEFALDSGAVECKDQSDPISEIEMELKAGDPKQLFGLALQLLDTIPLRAGNVNKAVRGYALYSPPKEVPIVKAAPVMLTPKMSVEDAFAAIVSNCMAHIQGNESGVLQGASESVHQMRVGVRRLRSALRLFGDAIAVPPDIGEGLSWLASALGAARDWDVLANQTLARVIGGCPEESGMNWLRTAANGVVREKREQAHEALHSTRYAKLVLTLASWRFRSGWREGGDEARLSLLEKPVSAFAEDMLRRSRKRLQKRGRHFSQLNVQKRHRMRIAAKKLRYATEFFQSICGQKRTGKYVKALSRLQDELGALNDAAVAQDLLPELKEMHPALAADIDFARGFLAYVARHPESALSQRWERFLSARPPHLKAHK